MVPITVLYAILWCNGYDWLTMTCLYQNIRTVIGACRSADLLRMTALGHKQRLPRNVSDLTCNNFGLDGTNLTKIVCCIKCMFMSCVWTPSCFIYTQVLVMHDVTCTSSNWRWNIIVHVVNNAGAFLTPTKCHKTQWVLHTVEWSSSTV